MCRILDDVWQLDVEFVTPRGPPRSRTASPTTSAGGGPPLRAGAG
ncbi:hypothetical protein [Clavibacter zhangzhiyongii]